MSTDPEFMRYAATQVRRELLHRASIEERAARLKAGAKHAAQELTLRYGDVHVWLFGSLAWGIPHATSDVDLMIEGLKPDHFFEAIKLVEDLVGTHLHFVRAEEAEASLVSRVKREGTLSA